MAQSTQNILLHNVRGKIGKQIVVKRYGKKSVITSYPDMSNIKPSEAQKQKRKRFAKAVAYAKAINNDPEKKALYKRRIKRGQTVYHFAIVEYLKYRMH